MTREADERESLWGINPQDRRWFQALTLSGGTGVSILVVFLEVSYRTSSITPNTIAQNIVLSIGASFVAAGFVTWSALQAKELVMAIADWIREATQRRRERLIEQGINKGIEQGINKGYAMGYDDANKGMPRRPPYDKPDRNGKPT